jgi:iron complex outermembrane receptor protein
MSKMTAYKYRWILAASALLLASATAPPAIAAKKPGTQDLFSMSLEQLTNVQVSSVSRHDEPLFDTPAAVFVITHDDIRRSGATSIPEVLRMVPGVEVAQIDANKWAVSARGFNNRFANKMLVMIDNRTVYNQLYSGVFWDQTDVLLEDVERIEIVRGPGATLWGANAVNGVINIVTRTASQSQGTDLVAEAGRIDQQTAARYGGHLSDSAAFRIYGKYLHRNALETADGQSAGDTAHIERAGFRLDWTLPARNALSFQGDLYDNAEQQRVNFDFASTGSTPNPVHAAPPPQPCCRRTCARTAAPRSPPSTICTVSISISRTVAPWDRATTSSGEQVIAGPPTQPALLSPSSFTLITSSTSPASSFRTRWPSSPAGSL